jgi:hypothetical protein
VERTIAWLNRFAAWLRMLKQPQAASETQNESLGRAHDEAPKLLTIARLILKQQTD